jgi:hypothetical protein
MAAVMTVLALFAEILRTAAGRCERCQGTSNVWYCSGPDPDDVDKEPCDDCFDYHMARSNQTFADLQFDDFELCTVVRPADGPDPAEYAANIEDALDAQERAKEEANR